VAVAQTCPRTRDQNERGMTVARKPQAKLCKATAAGTGKRCRNLTTSTYCTAHAGGVGAEQPMSTQAPDGAAAAASGGIEDGGPGVVSGHHRGMDLEGADITGVQWGPQPVVHEGVFDDCNAEGAQINGVFLHSSFKGVNAKFARFGGPHYASDFSGGDLSFGDLPDNDQGRYDRANLTSSTARRRSFDGATFDRTKIAGARFTRCDMSGADLSTIDGNMHDAEWRECFYDDKTTFPDGYDPESNGWIKTEKDGATQRRLIEARAAAKVGTFDPHATYVD
jgi:hypothetical protein